MNTLETLPVTTRLADPGTQVPYPSEGSAFPRSYDRSPGQVDLTRQVVLPPGLDQPENLGQSVSAPDRASARFNTPAPDQSHPSHPSHPSAPLPTAPIREDFAAEWAMRIRIAETVQSCLQSGANLTGAAHTAGVSIATAHRYYNALLSGGHEALRPAYDRCGRKSIHTLTPTETSLLQKLYLQTNRTEDAGSMRTAAKMLAHDPDTTDATRDIILAALAHGSHVPGCVRRVLQQVTPAHVGQFRHPRISAIRNFSGQRGARVDDKVLRRRVIESDDGTLNFVVCIPWPMGGDPCSDKYGVRVARAQWLPQIEAGWSHYVLGYSLVFRPRGAYRQDDIRDCIYRVALVHGLPDAFRFEHGAWESNRIVEMLGQLGVELETVDSPNSKAVVEGFFSKMWTYLSTLPGQVGRYRGEHESENRLMQSARAGAQDPRKHFPMLADATTGIDGAIAMHNTDTIRSVYGEWVPQVRHEQLSAERPWRTLTDNLRYVCAPVRREWTVGKGTVGGQLPILDDYKVPFYFSHQDLWRWNGHKVTLYFDPTADPCQATIVSQQDALGLRPGEVICRADLIGELPAYCRAAVGWAKQGDEYRPKQRASALAAVRRETRVMSGGRVVAAATQAADGRGSLTIAEVSPAAATSTPASRRTPAPTPPLPSVIEDLDNAPTHSNRPAAITLDTADCEILDQAHDRRLARQSPVTVEYL